jgi:hypothetical protein
VFAWVCKAYPASLVLSPPEIDDQVRGLCFLETKKRMNKEITCSVPRVRDVENPSPPKERVLRSPGNKTHSDFLDGL